MTQKQTPQEIASSWEAKLYTHGVSSADNDARSRTVQLMYEGYHGCKKEKDIDAASIPNRLPRTLNFHVSNKVVHKSSWTLWVGWIVT